MSNELVYTLIMVISDADKATIKHYREKGFTAYKT